MITQRRTGRFEIATGEQALDARQKIGVGADQIFEAAVFGTGFLHHHATVFDDDVSLDLAGVAMDEVFELEAAFEHRFARQLHAFGT